MSTTHSADPDLTAAEHDPEAPDEVGALAPAASSSLKARMSARKDELEAQTTEIFPVPRWNELLAVELQVVEWETTEDAIQEHLRRTKRTTLLTAADEIVAGTVGFYEIKDGELEPVEDASSWYEIAQGVLDLPAMPPKLAERTSLIDLCSSQGVMSLSTAYRRWMAGERTGIGDRLKQDF